jgi:predicted Zn-dependent protease
MTRLRLLGAAAAALAVVSPAMAEPRAISLKPDPSSAEAGLWDLFDKAEKDVQHSAELNVDPGLNAYVKEVVCKVAAEYCPETRVYVLDRPFFFATMAANGYSEVWSGLLLRVRNEAELAYVLGHEVGHFAENHSLERHRANKTRANVTMALSVGVALAGAVASSSAGTYEQQRALADATGNLIDVIYLAGVALYFGYSRDQEAEADLIGIRRASAAGYSPAAAPQVWREVVSETAASSFDRVRRNDARLGIFDTHPLTNDRIKVLEVEAAKLPAVGAMQPDRHRAAIRPHLARWLKDDLRRRDFGETLHILDRLAVSGEDLGVINFYRGEALRLRRAEGDLVLAQGAYEDAARYADAPVAVWRELGDLKSREKDGPGARAAYEAYLGKVPNAEDAWLVKDSLQALDRGSL